jgi:hypothetical protein
MLTAEKSMNETPMDISPFASGNISLSEIEATD